MDVHNTTVFERNTVTGLSGALYLESFGQLRVFPQTTLLFDENSGRFVIGISFAKCVIILFHL